MVELTTATDQSVVAADAAATAVPAVGLAAKDAAAALGPAVRPRPSAAANAATAAVMLR